MEKVARKILAIDYGEARIGLALADNEVSIAFGLATINNDHQMLQKLDEIISKNEIDLVVIGNTVDSRSRMMKDFQKMEKYLHDKELDVDFQEEMYSTIEAQRMLKEKGAKNIKQGDNREAARIILQSWLDRHCH